MIEPALELYAKYKAARHGFGKLMGDLPATPTARAGARVNQTRQRIAKAVETGLSRGSRAAAPIVTRTGKALVRRVEEITELAREPDRLRQQVRARVQGVPAAVARAAEDAAVKRVEYLAERAPKPPFQGSPWAPKGWEPSEAQAAEWSRILWTAENPAAAIESLLSADYSPVVARTVRELSPALWESARQQVMERLDQIAKLPRDRRVRLGLAFDLPLDGSQVPSYQQIADKPAEPGPQPNPKFGGPPAQSRQAELAQTPAERRMS